MAWKPPKKPADLRGVHVVDLSASSMKEADYFSLIVSRGVTINARQDFDRITNKPIEKKGPPVELATRPEPQPRPTTNKEDLGIQTGGGTTRAIAIVSSVVALTAGAYGLSQLIFGTSSRDPAKKVENPSDFAVPAEPESTDKLIETQEQTRLKLRAARANLKRLDGDTRGGGNEEPEISTELGRGRNRVSRESGGVSYTNAQQPQVVMPSIDSREHNAPPITDIPRDGEQQAQGPTQAQPMPLPAPGSNPFHGTAPPPGSVPMPDRTTANDSNYYPQPPPVSEPPSYVPDQQNPEARF